MSENHSVNVRLCGPLVSTSFLEFSTRDQIYKNVEKYVPRVIVSLSVVYLVLLESRSNVNLAIERCVTCTLSES